MKQLLATISILFLIASYALGQKSINLNKKQMGNLAEICKTIKNAKDLPPGCSKTQAASIACAMCFKETSLGLKLKNGKAKGHYQVTDSTLKLVNKRTGVKGDWRFSLQQSTIMSQKLLRLNTWKGGNVYDGVLAHNIGLGRAVKASKMPPDEKEKYLSGIDGGHAVRYVKDIKKYEKIFEPIVREQMKK